VAERAGVCRDFAHLGIALRRASNIPARYFAGYAHGLNPPDFHACFEAYVGGRWLIFDPTRLVPLNGLVRIAHGRDAANASVATIFGPAHSTSVQVSCEPAEAGFKPLSRVQHMKKGICLSAL
jgi:transglutaminase-like putative cysteine protease